MRKIDFMTQLIAFKSIFRSRIKFSTTYAIVLFFFSRPFHENFKFLKNSIRFSRNFAVILHPKGPLRVQRHQNRMAWM